MTQYEKKQLLTYLGAAFLGVGLISAFLILLLVAPWLGAIVGFIGMGAGFLWRASKIKPPPFPGVSRVTLDELIAAAERYRERYGKKDA